MAGFISGVLLGMILSLCIYQASKPKKKLEVRNNSIERILS